MAWPDKEDRCMKKIFEEYGEGMIALLVGGVIVGLFMQVLILAQ